MRNKSPCGTCVLEGRAEGREGLEEGEDEPCRAEICALAYHISPTRTYISREERERESERERVTVCVYVWEAMEMTWTKEPVQSWTAC